MNHSKFTSGIAGKGLQMLFVSLAFSLIFISCKKSDPGPPAPPATGRSLESITIKKSDNPGYSDDGFVFIRNDFAYITLPQNADPSKVKLTFKVSPGAKLSLDGRDVTNVTGTFDLSKTVKAVVTSGAGSARAYQILAQPGIADIDKLFYDFKEKYNIPGVSVAILKMDNSQIVYKTGLGFAEVETGVRTRPDHLFRLASISKQFTSISIMKLVDQGKLSVDDKVFGAGGILEHEFTSVSDRAAQVTVRHLLNHTSGWESNPDPMFTSSFKGQSLDQRIQHVLSSPQSLPGSKYSYFNMGFGMLGKIIEKVTGKKFEVFMKEVLAEANITDIHVGGDRAGKRANEVVYYSQDGYNGYGNEMEVIAAAGGVIASTEQMLKLITYIDGRPTPADILTPDTRTLMLTSSGSNTYALGWRMNHRLFPGAWYHGGNLAGTGVFWVMGPQYSTVILCNSRSYISGFDDDFYYISEKMINYAAQNF